jgi:hypothetical protein
VHQDRLDFLLLATSEPAWREICAVRACVTYQFMARAVSIRIRIALNRAERWAAPKPAWIPLGGIVI